MPRITPNLWFDPEGKEAPRFYVAGLSVDISEVVQIMAAVPAAHLVVESWMSAGGLRTRDRR